MAKTGHAHIVGICGTAMASLAGILRDAGWRVTGSDANAWPPMSTQLEALGIAVMCGYDPAHLDPRPDVVVVGNVCRRDNPEAAAAIQSGIPHYSMPSFLEEHFLQQRHSVVVAGTHGKTTTTAMIAWVLRSAGRDPSYLVGGVPENFGRSAAIGAGPHFVVEGDEYDTAFFDKGPKFLHYRPRTAVVTGVEFDHADIYRDLEHYRSAFERFVSIIPADGDLVAHEDDAVTGVLSGARCRVHRYGAGTGVAFGAGDVSFTPDGCSFAFTEGGTALGRIEIALGGVHNVLNATAAAGACRLLGLRFEEIAAGLRSFSGVERRQTNRGTWRGVTIIDDFAHHPTAVAETIAGVRRRYLNGGAGRLVAVFEPRSNTSRRGVFQERYAQAFAGADLAVIAAPYQASSLAESERLDAARLAASIAARGLRAVFQPDVPAILAFLSGELKQGDVVLVMSNGVFDNLVARLSATLSGGQPGAAV